MLKFKIQITRKNEPTIHGYLKANSESEAIRCLHIPEGFSIGLIEEVPSTQACMYDTAFDQFLRLAKPPADVCPAPKFWASVDQRLLKKVDRIFDASPKTVWVELLQNARRAKATEVTVELSSSDTDPTIHVRFRDNGKGLDSPAPLLTLASRGWNDETEAAEDPAGMGFFCLSNFKSVMVSSKDWRALLTPAVFRQEEGVEQEQTISYMHGFEVMMVWEDVDIQNVSYALQAAAAFCQLEKVTIKLNGATTHVIKPQDFLKDSELPVREVPELGVRIGCQDNPNCHSYGFYRHAPSVELNFRGVSISWSNSDDIGQHLYNINNARALLKVDVLHTRELQLVLPSRNAVKHTPGRLALQEELERTAYEWLKKNSTHKEEHRRHSVPFRVYKRAKEKFGIDIGEAQERLQHYVTAPADEGLEVRVGGSLRNWSPLARIVLQHNREQAKNQNPGLTLVCNDDGMQGYTWYDNMPTLADVVVKVDGEVIPYDDMISPDDHKRKLYQWADSLEVELRISNGSVLKVTPPVLIAGGDPYREWVEVDSSALIYLSKSIEHDPAMLTRTARELHEELFDSDAGESYSEAEVEEMSEQFIVDVTAWLMELTGQTKKARVHLMQETITKIKWSTAREDVAWTLQFDGREKDRGIRLTSFQYTEEEEANHKTLCGMPNGKDSWAEEIVSDKPVTPDRIEAYLKAQYGFDLEKDGYAIDTVTPVVNLDEWEAKNLKGKETSK